jgi:2-dehydro-3-deoxyphosphogluconate aldolase/(4S)-4-hydroxy-2-oxoglutarate aldolase
MELGADALALHPAAAFSPRWVADLRASIPLAPFLAVGGITLAAAPEWIAAGAVAVGLDSPLTEGDRPTVAKRLSDLLPRLSSAGLPL